MNPKELKSADDWAKLFKLHSCVGNKKFESQIKQIQLNAYKTGMTEAAEIVSEYSSRLSIALKPLQGEGDWAAQWYVRATNDDKNAILSTRDRKITI